MNSIILAALLTLNPGYNNPGVAGEVVAIEAATTNATATIAIKSVQSITAYTNATAQVVNFETAYALTGVALSSVLILHVSWEHGLVTRLRYIHQRRL